MMEGPATNQTELLKKSAGRFSKGSLVFMILPLNTVIFLIDLITCIAMSQTKRIPFPTKFLTCFSLGCDCVFSFLLISAAMSVLVEVPPVPVAIYTEIGRITAALSWVSVTLMLAERVLCFRYPNWYAQKADNKNVVISTSVIMLVIIATKVAVRYVILPLARGEEFDFVAQTRDEQLLTWILGMCLIFGIACYVMTINIIKRHIRLISDIGHSSTRPLRLMRTYTSTKSVIIIFAVFLCIHVPLFLCLVLNNVHRSTTISRFAVLIAMFTISLVNPFLYGWRFQECRYIMVQKLARTFHVLEDRAERMRYAVYSIVTPVETSVSVIKTEQDSFQYGTHMTS